MLVEDRRKHMRLKSDFTGKCFSVNGIEKSEKIKILNITREGACMLGKESFHKGDKISLEVILNNDQQTVPIAGEIAWVDTNDNAVYSGISFSSINSIQRFKLFEELLERLSNQ